MSISDPIAAKMIGHAFLRISEVEAQKQSPRPEPQDKSPMTESESVILAASEDAQPTQPDMPSFKKRKSLLTRGLPSLRASLLGV